MFDPDHVVEHHAGQMRGRAGAGRAELHLGLVGFRIGDEFLEIVRRQVLAGDEGDRGLGHQGDRREIRRRIIERLLEQRLVLRMGPDAAEHHRVAVGRRLGDAHRAGHAARAPDVLDDDLLAERLAHALGDDAAEHVLRAAGRERDDHHHGMVGEILRHGGAGKRRR